MPSMKLRTFLDIRDAGQQLSNLCFNLSQVDGNKYAKEMKEAQIKWDRAMDAYREEWRAKREKKHC